MKSKRKSSKQKSKSKLPIVDFEFGDQEFPKKSSIEEYQPQKLLTQISEEKIHFYQKKHNLIFFASKDSIRLTSLESGLEETDLKIIEVDIGIPKKIFIGEKFSKKILTSFWTYTYSGIG